MSKISDTQNKTYGSVAALQTLTNSYPKLNIANSILGALQTTSPMQFLLNILRIVGVTQTDLINWLAKILCGEPLYEKEETLEEIENREKVLSTSDAVLDQIEYAIKGLLFLNIKDLFCGCQIEPFIPEWLFKEDDQNSNIGISIPISSIDMFGVLQNCPVNDKESIYYFDCKPNIFGYNYTPNDVCNSTDFNAFLWHVINKSDSYGDVWDNRNKVKKELLSNVNTIPNIFFNNSNNKINPSKKRLTDANGGVFYYRPIIICQYINSGAINEGGSIIKITIPKKEYMYHKKNGDSTMFPRTIFEFNYDYIYSLKLFDTKTLVANILNSLLGLSTEIHADFHIERNTIKNEITTIVENLLSEDGASFNALCAMSFSNEEYNKILNNSNNYIKKNNLRTPNSIEVEEILSKIKKLEYSSNIESDLLDLLNTTSEYIKPTEDTTYSAHFTFDISFIEALIKELMTEIIIQVFSPKVMMLYYINTCVMNGAVDNFENWKNFGLSLSNYKELLLKFSNLITNMIRQIIDILLKQLMQFLIEKITPALKIFAMELLLETIRDYKDLITQIITTCGLSIMSYTKVGSENLVIDEVTYADIVPVLEVPNNDC